MRAFLIGGGILSGFSATAVGSIPKTQQVEASFLQTASCPNLVYSAKSCGLNTEAKFSQQNSVGSSPKERSAANRGGWTRQGFLPEFGLESNAGIESSLIRGAISDPLLSAMPGNPESWRNGGDRSKQPTIVLKEDELAAFPKAFPTVEAVEKAENDAKGRCKTLKDLLRDFEGNLTSSKYMKELFKLDLSLVGCLDPNEGDAKEMWEHLVRLVTDFGVEAGDREKSNRDTYNKGNRRIRAIYDKLNGQLAETYNENLFQCDQDLTSFLMGHYLLLNSWRTSNVWRKGRLVKCMKGCRDRLVQLCSSDSTPSPSRMRQVLVTEVLNLSLAGIQSYKKASATPSWKPLRAVLESGALIVLTQDGKALLRMPIQCLPQQEASLRSSLSSRAGRSRPMAHMSGRRAARSDAYLSRHS